MDNLFFDMAASFEKTGRLRVIPDENQTFGGGRNGSEYSRYALK